MLDKAAFMHDFDTQGYSVVKNGMPPEFVARCKTELVQAIEIETASFKEGKDHRDYAMVLICSLYGRSFIDLFDIPAVTAGMNAVLGDGCITYAYTSSSMPPKGTNYSRRIHVDSPRLIPGFRTNIGVVCMLDDFTAENGATWVLPGSQTRPEPPSEEEFYRDGRQIIAPAGSIFFFDARLWHSGGINTTDQWRHAVTINVCRPWMKQRLDIPRAMANVDISGASETALQKLGYRAQVPANYDEFFAPPEQRKYRQKPE